MRAVVQRVSAASVIVDGETVGAVEQGALILLGVGHGDDRDVADKLAGKISRLRIFEDADGRMNLSLLDIGGSALVVSQFTLLADASKGNRPSYVNAAAPEKADPLYRHFCEELIRLGVPVARGVFGAHMQVSLVNDGPVTIVLDM